MTVEPRGFARSGTDRRVAVSCNAPQGGYRLKRDHSSGVAIEWRAVVGHPPLLVACLARATIVWAGVRAMALLGGLGLTGPSSAAVALFVAIIVYIDARVTRELIYLGNLGLPGRWLVLWSGAQVLVLEAIARAVIAIVRALW